MKGARKLKHIASIAGLKARLSEYLRFVKAGGEVTVAERGRPIARIVPITGGAAASARVSELSANGLIRSPSSGFPPEFFRRPCPADPAGRSLEIVLEERAEDR